MLSFARSRIAIAASLVFAVAATVFTAVAITRQPSSSAAPQTAVSRTPRSRIPAQEHAAFRQEFNASNFGKSRLSAAQDRFGVAVSFPQTALDGEYEGTFLPAESDDSYREGFLLVYTNDLTVRVTRWPSRKDALSYLEIYNPPELREYVHTVDINGNEGYGLDRLDVPVVAEGGTDPSTGLGKIKPGTGVSSSVGSVAWAHGPFVVEVNSEDADSVRLADVARGIAISQR